MTDEYKKKIGIPDNQLSRKFLPPGRVHEEVKILMNIFYASSTKMEK